ncbi:MAG TPA: hypothetical protein VFF04_06765, partial [Candidatus Babeliales bacterium]|nr:hypothetical protein [Candidatus Babeliales bacterium]
MKARDVQNKEIKEQQELTSESKNSKSAAEEPKVQVPAEEPKSTASSSVKASESKKTEPKVQEPKAAPAEQKQAQVVAEPAPAQTKSPDISKSDAPKA